MISMPIHLGDKDFLDDHGVEVSYKEFYDELRNGAVPKTSQITPVNFFDKFKLLYENNKDVVQSLRPDRKVRTTSFIQKEELSFYL